MAKLRITQVRSTIRTRPEHRGTLRALGLRRIGQSVVHEDSPALQGMLRRVASLVKVEEENDRHADDRDATALHTLKPAEGSHRERKRVGRGHGSGNGKTVRPRAEGPEGAVGQPRHARRASRAARCRSTCGWASSAARTTRCRCRWARSAPTPRR